MPASRVATTTVAAQVTATTVVPADLATTVPAGTQLPATVPTLSANPDPTTVVPVASAEDNKDPLLLRPDGFGRFPFGTPLAEVLVGSPPELGAPLSDTSSDYSNPGADGEYLSADESTGFSFPVGRQYCWTELCLNFGGTDSTNLRLVGWRYASNGTAPLFGLKNVDGVSIGSRWSDFPASISADPGGCYTVGGGVTTDGIFLVLQGGIFGKFNDDGSYEALVPEPSEVTVIQMNAGEQVVYLFEDC